MDTSVRKDPAPPTPPATSGGGTTTPSTPGGAGQPGGTGAGTTPPPTEPTQTVYRKITISGDVPLENYAQLFTSFVQTLRSNRLKIEVKFTAHDTASNPLAENSPTVKSVKESASQLGLKFEAEK